MKSHHVLLIYEAKVWHATCIKEAVADCACTLAKTENCCSKAIREAESQGASQAHLIQQSHAKGIQHLEAEDTEEERRECLAFLSTCGTTLRSSLPEAHEIMVTPFHLLLGNAPMSTLLHIPPEVFLLQQEPAPQTPPASATIAPEGFCLGPSSDTSCLIRWSLCPHQRPPLK